jgi:hypothetical protein
MGKLYKGQTDLTIKVEVGVDLTGFTSAKLIFQNPRNIEKIAESTTVQDAPNGILEFIANDANFFNESGRWLCWARCVNAQGLISIGEPSAFFIYEEGN